MAIEGVMKIFLMIAVIIVGMSFLLKAFGIDILGWLQEKFTGFGVPESGAVLHIKIDPGDNPLEIWEFGVTNGEPSSKYKDAFGETSSETVVISDKPNFDHEGKFFTLKDISTTDRCIIFVTDEEGGDEDEGMVYEVKQGVIIDSNLCSDGKSLEECIGTSNIENRVCKWVTRNGGDNVKCVGNNCVLKLKWENGVVTYYNNGNGFSKGESPYACHNYLHYLDCSPSDGVNNIIDLKKQCDYEEHVLKQAVFGSGVFNDDGCLKTSEKCNLLGETKDVLKDLHDKKIYKVKFGVICKGGEWEVCTPQRAEKGTGTVAGKTCKPKEDYFVWE